MSDPKNFDWDEADPANRTWLEDPGLVAWADYTDLQSEEGGPFFRVLCPICQFRVDSYRQLKARYDNVLVCHNCWDPEPRGYRRSRKSLRVERKAVTRRKGALHFGEDIEGR